MRPHFYSVKLQNILLIAGLVLLALWTAVWMISVRKNHLVIENCTLIPPWPILCCDFDANYYATYNWIAGNDPYQGIHQLEHFKYNYPPLVLVLFSWCVLMSRNLAVVLWLFAQTVVFSLAAFLCWRSRNKFDLFQVPFPLLLAATFFSFPVLFEMDRGNCNMLVLLFLILSVWSLSGCSLACDFLAGAFAGVAAWIKIYPALILLGLLVLRRWRAAVFFGAVVLLIGLFDVRETLEFAENIKESAKLTPDFVGKFCPWSHTVSGSWLAFCSSIHLSWPDCLPRSIGWGLLVFPLVLWVSYWIAKAHQSTQLVYPYFLWLTAAASYLPAIANDYSLIFLPLAALAVWDRRDKVFVHVLMIFMLIWWQPFWLPVPSKFLWCFKLVGLGAVALSLVIRAQEQGMTPPVERHKTATSL